MWRRFVPRRRPKIRVQDDSGRTNIVRSVEDSGALARELKQNLLPRPGMEEQAHLRQQVILLTPKAALAQAQMDTHKHGYHNREKRLYELIEFNDAFVSYVLAMPHEKMPGLTEDLKRDMIGYCKKLRTPMFTDEQFDAIVRGLSREIAVFRAARYQGFDVRMTSRTDDAFGIDMVITQPETGKHLNVDCKTPPAFRHRLEDLVHHGKISEQQLLRADEVDYLTSMHRRDDEQVPVTLLCIRPDTLGDIHDFSFDDSKKLAVLLNKIFATI